MAVINSTVADAIINNINTFLVQLGQFGAAPLAERDQQDAQVVNRVRVSAAALNAAVDAVARLPQPPQPYPGAVQPPMQARR